MTKKSKYSSDTIVVGVATAAIVALITSSLAQEAEVIEETRTRTDEGGRTWVEQLKLTVGAGSLGSVLLYLAQYHDRSSRPALTNVPGDDDPFWQELMHN